MRKLWAQLRCLIAETLLNWALNATPRGSGEELAMCYAVARYRDLLKEYRKGEQ